MKSKIIHLVVLVFLLFSCGDQEPSYLPLGSQLVLNPNLALYPDSVIPWESSKSRDQFETGISREVFFTGNRSFFIENKDSNEFAVASWSQTYTGPMPREGSTVELLAFIKGENIRSLRKDNNVSISFSAQDSNGEVVTIASANNLIEGDFDWYLLKTTMDNFPSDMKSIEVSVGLNSRVLGKAYFDEINLFVR